MTDSEHLAAFLAWLRDVRQDYDMALAELGEDGYHNRAKLALALRKARQRRRRGKDKLTILQPVIGWLEAEQKTIKALERLLGEMRRLEKSLVGRSYHPKTDVVAKTLRKQKEAKQKEIKEDE